MSQECSYFKELIKEDLAGELSREKRLELNEHLSGCPACAGERAELSRVMEFLGEFDEQPVPRHFFVREQPRISLAQAFRSLAPSQRWAAAGIAVMILAMFGLVLMDTHIRFQDSTLTVSLGKPAELYSSRQVRAEITAAVRAAREEDRLMMSRQLAAQTRLLEGSVNHVEQQVDARLSEFQGRVAEAMDSSNRELKTQMEASLYKYGEWSRVQQDDLRRINGRLDQVMLDGRRRETQNGAIMVALARYGLTTYQPQGGIYE